ncbi:MAG: ComEC/Rec2 family competence protein [Bacteroidales bacterium]|nr:ComEC/Rec2 family competence protein [Bacteroidales bacterium]
MKKGGGIILLSIPFAAGVAVAELAANAPAMASAALASIVTSLIVSTLCKSSGSPPLLLLFFALGALCRSTETLAGGIQPAVPFPGAIDSFAAAIENAGFPGEHSSAIITALLTGRRGALEKSTIAAFRRSGASHILALSGLHLGVIYIVLRRCLAPLGNTPPARLVRGIITVGLCAMYTLMTGAGPSITRAFLFIAINETGRSLSARRHSPLGTFCLALTLQLALRPSLIASAGFQLSYLAMLGIIVLYPRLENWYPRSSRADPLRRIWKAAALSISCQLFTAPAAWWHFRSLPKYFLITNLLALPLAEGIIICALVCLALGAAGICPLALVRACGNLVQLLEFCLETISGL